MRLDNFKKAIGNITPGETIRVDHGMACSAGEETRRRLYLTRPLADPEIVIGYCHNCGEGGKYNDTKYTAFRDDLHKNGSSPAIQQSRTNSSPPKGMVKKLRDWPVHSQVWAMKNKLDQLALDTYQIAHDTTSNRVYLPRYKKVHCNIEHGGSGLQGYQLRLTQDDKGSKYWTITREDDDGFTELIPYHTAAKNTIVVVEDLVSGIHVIRADTTDTVSVLVNYGVKINPVAIPTLNEFDKVVVWLDNDSPYVKDQALKYARTIALYGTAAEARLDNTDPKHYSSTEIRTIIDG